MQYYCGLQGKQKNIKQNTESVAQDYSDDWTTGSSNFSKVP